MPRAAKKKTAPAMIVFSRARDIPFNRIKLSDSNVRETDVDAGLDDLTHDINYREDLIQGLNVRAILDADGDETGDFETPAGGRRYRSIQRLVEAGRFPADGLVPCIVKKADAKTSALDDSLAENLHRLALHPLDQFNAFKRMVDMKIPKEEIAAAYRTTTRYVVQRLRLATVAPSLLEAYARDEMTLTMLEAFTVNPDHARQEQVWERIRSSWQKDPWHIRNLLTETTVPSSDKRVSFVGLDAYEAAGGAVLRDLFSDEDQGWVQDVALLDRLVEEKLKVIADEIAAEGWKRIEVLIELPYGYANGLRKLVGVSQDLTDEERASREALRSELDDLESQYADADELPDEVDQRLGEIEAALDAFENRPVTFDPADMARAGVFLSIDRNGRVLVDRGYVRPEDEMPAGEPELDGETDPAIPAGNADPGAPAVQRTVITIGRQAPATDDEDDDDLKPLPDRLVTELTAERTLALRDKLANTPAVAFQAVLHKFCLDVFSRYFSYGTAMEVSVRSVSFPVQAQGLKDTRAAKAIDARHAAWEERLPKDKADLWDWLTTLSGNEQAALFAHCASFGVNALYERGDRYGGGASSHTVGQRIADADRLAQAVDLDLVQAGWRPTVDNYLGRVPKRRILEAVRQGAGERAAQLIDHLKKGDMAKEAERLLADSGWLPEPLRIGATDATPAVGEDEGDGDTLPEFLADDEEEPAGEDADAPHMIAAE
jgi:ParB family transcriptional regulator, chromosome partitioning protein